MKSLFKLVINTYDDSDHLNCVIETVDKIDKNKIHHKMIRIDPYWGKEHILQIININVKEMLEYLDIRG